MASDLFKTQLTASILFSLECDNLYLLACNIVPFLFRSYLCD